MFYIYIGCLTFGILYSVVSLVLGTHGFDHGAAHAGAGDHGGDGDLPSPFNPLVMASAITAFGAVGLISKIGFKMGDLASSVLSLTFAGITGAAIFFGVVKLMYNSQSNSTFSIHDLEGEEAEITTPIPAGGFGEISYTYNGIRYSFPARSSDGSAIARGKRVQIREITGNIALVTQKITLDELDLELAKDEDNKETEKNKN